MNPSARFLADKLKGVSTEFLGKVKMNYLPSHREKKMGMYHLSRKMKLVIHTCYFTSKRI